MNTPKAWIPLISTLLLATVGCTSADVATQPTEPSVPAADGPPALGPPTATTGTPTGPDLTPVADASAAADRLVCWFAWRKSDTHGFAKRNHKVLPLRDAGDGDSFRLGDQSIDIALADSGSGGLRLDIDVAAGQMQVAEDYDFGSERRLANLPPAGHGFTGLRYVTHPSSSSELQYGCETLEPGQTFDREGVDPPTHGPAAPGDAAISCEVSGTDGHGPAAPLAELVVTGPDAADPRQTLGSVTWSSSRIDARYEAGSLFFDTAVGKGGVRDMYQDHGTLPANLMPSGFTGTRTIRDAVTGAEVTYVCAATTPT